MKNCKNCPIFKLTNNGWGYCLILDGYLSELSGKLCPYFKELNEIIEEKDE
jgi:hypothetical protein